LAAEKTLILFNLSNTSETRSLTKADISPGELVNSTYISAITRASVCEQVLSYR
jgi:hypothetical protein